MSKISLSWDSLNCIHDYIDLNPLSLRRRLIDIIFVFDIITYNTVRSDFLSEINFRIPYGNIRNSDLFLVPLFKSNCSTNSFLP